ncbi:MAG: hypothetical protein J2P32_16045, partial [Actinobacteria bacterium]|nr:hypothetical protein [Actinomycetota bacterium]
MPARNAGSLLIAAAAAVALAAGCTGHVAVPAASVGGGHGGRGAQRSAALPFPASENARRGTWDWHITNLGAPDAIEGYADHVSVLPGQSFRVFVSTTSRTYRVLAFRMGWYGGRQARRVWKSGRLP